MVETLTESFCERCGTRYEFRAPTRLTPLRKTRGFIGGLKNYLTSQDALSDAMGDAMRSEEDQLAAAQLDAFHDTFNFCIGCRQYTCVNCWNDAEGRCRSCAPIAGTDDLTERLLAVQPGTSMVATAAPPAEPMPAGDGVGRRIGLEAWPQADHTAHAGSNGHAADEWPVADNVTPAAEPEVDTWPESQSEHEPAAAEIEPDEAAAAAVEAQPEPEPIAAELEPEGEPVAAEAEFVEPTPLRVVAWETDGAYGVAEPVVEREPEHILAEMEAEPDLEPESVAAEAEPEPLVVEAEPEPVAAEAEPEPVAAEAEPEAAPPMHVAPISETILRFPERPTAPAPVERPAAEADSPELAARRAQLDLLGLGDPGEGPVAAERPAVLPYRSRGAAPTSAEIAGRPGGPGFWEASAREVAGVAAQIGVQNCGECGLSLSATARFCRRCGTRQARSA